MGQLLGFGGGGDAPKQPDPNKTREAEGAILRRRASAASYRNNVLSGQSLLGQMYSSGLKRNTGE